MLQEFLKEMATITAMAVEPEMLQQGDDSSEEQPTPNDEPSDTISDKPSNDDPSNDDPAKPTAEPAQEPAQESAAITSKQHLSDVTEAVGEGLDTQSHPMFITEFCDEHGVTLPEGNPTKKVICLSIAQQGFTAENVCQWLEHN